MKNIVIEMAQFRLNEHVSEQTFLAEAEKVQRAFLEKQKGYLDRELLKGEDEQWIDLLHWESMEEALAAAEAIWHEPSCQEFIQMLLPQSVHVSHLTRQKSWSL